MAYGEVDAPANWVQAARNMRTLLMPMLALGALGACGGANPPPQDVHQDLLAAPSAPASAAPAASGGDAPTLSASSSAPTPAASAPAPMAAGATASSGAPASADKVYDQTTTAIAASVGDHFTVVVPGNATTSYTWRVDPKPDASVLSVADPKYTPQPPPGCNGQCVGYGGTYAFAATANAAGAAKLHLVKVHVGREPGTPVQEVSIAVTVK